ncbi:MAG: hypothetical protein VKK04_15015 [Synechococcales bacterium]|nr:hypothetical protein [Synechococcales bacterium]
MTPPNQPPHRIIRPSTRLPLILGAIAIFLSLVLLVGNGLGQGRSSSAGAGSAEGDGIPQLMGQRTLTLQSDQPVVVEPSQMELTLVDVVDSRCPTDVQCVWGGGITITLAVQSAETPRQQVELSRLPGQEPESQSISGVTLSLVDVTPHPRSNRTPSPEDYTATIRVSTPQARNIIRRSPGT